MNNIQISLKKSSTSQTYVYDSSLPIDSYLAYPFIYYICILPRNHISSECSFIMAAFVRLSKKIKSARRNFHFRNFKDIQFDLAIIAIMFLIWFVPHENHPDDR